MEWDRVLRTSRFAYMIFLFVGKSIGAGTFFSACQPRH